MEHIWKICKSIWNLYEVYMWNFNGKYVNNQSLCHQYPVLYQNRYCYQEDNDVIIFKKKNSTTCYVDRLLKFKGIDFFYL